MAGRLPSYGPLRVENRPRSAPAPRQLPGGGFSELSAGLNQLGRGVDVAIEEYQRAEHEADVVAVRNALTEAENRGIKRLHSGEGTQTNSGSVLAEAGEQGATKKPGYLTLEGMAAFEARAGVLEDLDGDLKDISGKLASDKQRTLFEEHAGGLRNRWERTVEEHASGQFRVAKRSAVAAAEANAVRLAALTPDDDELAGNLVAGVVGPARALAPSPAAADEAAIAVQANVARARLDNLLANSNVPSAERVLKASRGALGADADRYDKAINQVKLGTQAQSTALDIVAKGVGDDGQVDQTVVLDELGKVPPELREKVRPIAFSLMAEREQAYAKETERISRASHTLYNTKGWAEFEKSGLSTELNYRNPALYERLRDDSREKYKAWKRAQSGAASDKAAQRETNKDARNAFLALPVEEQASADLSEFLLGRGTGPVAGTVDPVPNELAKLQQAARSHVEKGLGVSVESFKTGLRASLQKYAPKPGTTRESRARAATWWADNMAAGVDEYNLWVNNNPTKKPTAVDIESIKAEVTGRLPPNPEHPESITEAGRALSIRGGGAGAPEPAKVTPIPPAERAQIEDALRQKGRVITEDAVQALYNQVRRGR